MSMFAPSWQSVSRAWWAASATTSGLRRWAKTPLVFSEQQHFREQRRTRPLTAEPPQPATRLIKSYVISFDVWFDFISQRVYGEDDISDKVPDSNSELETIFENSRSELASSGNGSGSTKHNHENPLFFDLLPQARPEMAAGWLPEVGLKIASSWE